MKHGMECGMAVSVAIMGLIGAGVNQGERQRAPRSRGSLRTFCMYFSERGASFLDVEQGHFSIQSIKYI